MHRGKRPRTAGREESMTPALALFLALSGPVPDWYGVPGVAQSYEPMVHYWADTYLIRRSLARSLLRQESQFRPRATGNEWVEVKGAWKRGKVLSRGMAMISVQYQDVHVRAAGMSPKAFRWWNAGDSVRVGFCFLGGVIAKYGDVVAVAMYNAGEARIKSALPIPRETIGYLKAVLE